MSGETVLSLSARDARRLAIRAQGFSAPSPGRVAGRARLAGLAAKLGALQIDSVNRVTRAHYLPPLARIGGYRREDLDALAWGRGRRLFEYWGHAASLLPLDLQPHLRWRMQEARDGVRGWTGLRRFGAERRAFISEVLDEVRRRGPVTGADFAPDTGRRSGWWEWSEGKTALEWLFWAGHLTTKTRRGFERVYDLTERVLPSDILARPTPARTEAMRRLVLAAAEALGPATASDLGDYFRTSGADTRRAVAELTEAGALLRANVEGWREPGFVTSGLASGGATRTPPARALLSPFDNLIWTRDRAERMFGVRIRIEIYTPAHRRTYGYYVMPFLLGDRIAARVDLKADRESARLLALAAHPEGEPDESLASELASSLTRMAEWLGLDAAHATGDGPLDARLRSALGR